MWMCSLYVQIMSQTDTCSHLEHQLEVLLTPKTLENGLELPTHPP